MSNLGNCHVCCTYTYLIKCKCGTDQICEDCTNDLDTVVRCVNCKVYVCYLCNRYCPTCVIDICSGCIDNHLCPGMGKIE